MLRKLTATRDVNHVGGFVRTLMHAPRSRKRSIAAATLGALALVGSLLVATPAQALNDTGTGGVFTPATGRILDTAKGTGGFSTPREAGKYRTIQVTGLAGVPDDGSVGAVSLNATVGTAPGNGTLFGRPDADTSRTSMLIYNGNTGEYVSNTAAIAVGADGTIQIMAETSARVILDVQGYYTANTDGTAAGGFVPVAGKRFVDTRSGLGAPKATIAPGKSVDVQVTGANGVPAGASGAVVNLIAINSTSSDGNLTPYATGSTKPQNSLHYTPSATTSIQAQVALSADGKMTIANASSTVNLVIDLQGYFTAAGKTGASFTPGTGRAYDSRATGNTILAKNETRSVQIAGKAGVPVMGSGITAVVLTLIVAHGGSDGRAAVWADGAAKPDTTSINFQTDEIRTNTVTVPLGANGKISLNNVADATNYVIDVQGWYANPVAPKVTCASPYTAGTWAKTLPSSISCSATVQAATNSDEMLVVSANGDDPIISSLSDTAPTTKTLALSPLPGQNTVTADLYDGEGFLVASTAYAFGLGDWSGAPLVLAPDNGTALATPVTLAALPDTSGTFMDDVLTTYRVSASADLSTPLWVSDPTAADADIPEGVLQDGGTYYWAATASGSTDWFGTSGSVTSPVQSFVVDNTNGIPGSTNADTAACRAQVESLADDNSVAPDSDLDFSCGGGLVSVTENRADGSTAEYSENVAPAETSAAPAGIQAKAAQTNCNPAKGPIRTIVSEVQDNIDFCVVYGQTGGGKKSWSRSILVYWDMYAGYPSAQNKVQTVPAAGKPTLSGTVTSQQQRGVFEPKEMAHSIFRLTGGAKGTSYVVGGYKGYNGSGSVKIEDLVVDDPTYKFHKVLGVGSNVASHRFHCSSSGKRCWYPNKKEAGL